MTEESVEDKRVRILKETELKTQSEYKTYVAQTSDHSLCFPVAKSDLIYLWDIYGNEYLDFTSGIGVMNMGHNNPRVQAEVMTQLRYYTHTMVYGEHIQVPQVEYARAISKRFPLKDGMPQQVFFVNSGNEAIDLALKMARKLSGSKKMIAIKGGFHGRGLGAMSVTSSYTQGFFPDNHETRFLDRNDDVNIRGIHTNDFNCTSLIMELVQGEAGCIPLEKPWVKDLVTRVKQGRGTGSGLVIVDEVQTGYGRTGTFLAQEQYEIEADITCLGKAGGGGFPFGAVVASRELFERLQTPPLSHLSTFGGNPVAMAAGQAVINQITPELLSNVAESGQALENGVNELVGQFPDIVSGQQGLGLMRGLILTDKSLSEPFHTGCLQRGLLLHFKLNAGNVLRMSPPLVISPREVRRAVDIMADVCLELQGV